MSAYHLNSDFPDLWSVSSSQLWRYCVVFLVYLTLFLTHPGLAEAAVSDACRKQFMFQKDPVAV